MQLCGCAVHSYRVALFNASKTGKLGGPRPAWLARATHVPGPVRPEPPEALPYTIPG